MMKNKIILLITALILFFGGIDIGKSSKKSVVKEAIKTNFVQISITNTVEKELPEYYSKALNLYSAMEGAKFIDYNELPAGIDSIGVSVFLPDFLKDKVSIEIMQNQIEYELRKIGVRIDDKSPVTLTYEIEAIENKKNNQIVTAQTLALYGYVNVFASRRIYMKRVPIWHSMSYGTSGTASFDQKLVNEYLSDKLVEFCNKVLKAREKK